MDDFDKPSHYKLTRHRNGKRIYSRRKWLIVRSNYKDKKEISTSGLKEHLETLLKSTTIASAILYVLGLVVVNTYLNQFGYSSLNLLNSRYLAAGAWLALPLAVGLFIDVGFIYVFQNKIPKKYENLIIVLVILIVLLGCGGSMHILTHPERISSLHYIGRFFVFVLIGIFLWIPALLTTVVVYQERQKAFSDSNLLVENITILIVTVYALWLFVGVFANNVYGDIPAYLGGGEPRLVHLVVASDAKEDLSTVGIKFVENTHKSEPLSLLMATKTEYLLLTNNGNSSISLRNDIVQAVLYNDN